MLKKQTGGQSQSRGRVRGMKKLWRKKSLKVCLVMARRQGEKSDPRRSTQRVGSRYLRPVTLVKRTSRAQGGETQPSAVPASRKKTPSTQSRKRGRGEIQKRKRTPGGSPSKTGKSEPQNEKRDREKRGLEARDSPAPHEPS